MTKRILLMLATAATLAACGSSSKAPGIVQAPGVGVVAVGAVGVVVVGVVGVGEVGVAAVSPWDGASTIFVPGLLLPPQAVTPTATSASMGTLESRLIMGRGAG